jgi:hypothetical protein
MTGGKTRGSLWRTFRAPLVLAVVSLLGLIAALLVDGPVDILWSLAVAVPLAVIAWALGRR